jgi:glycosyltransferase involved in cell wall biosynthesis
VRILLFGKYPPIQGGTSSQTLQTVRVLAGAGHEVQVVTNAAEAEPAARATFGPGDEDRLHAFGRPVGPGSITVHLTRSVAAGVYLPWAKPFGSQLFGVGAHLAAVRRFDLIVGWYLEPYGLAAGHVAQATGTPLALRHAGSDTGRLSRHPDLGHAYRWLLSRADWVLTGPRNRDRLISLGARAGSLIDITRGLVPDYFAEPVSSIEDLLEELGRPLRQSIRDLKLRRGIQSLLLANFDRAGELLGRVRVGICGKVGPTKGSHDLIQALELLLDGGADLTLLGAVGGPTPLLEDFFEAVAATRRLRDRALLFPYLAPWRMPAFFDSCTVFCQLERHFDVQLHRSRVPEEVLTRGRPLVLSAEIASKLGFGRLLIDGQNCSIIDYPEQIDVLASTLGRLLADAEGRDRLGAAGRQVAVTLAERHTRDGPADAITGILATLA